MSLCAHVLYKLTVRGKKSIYMKRNEALNHTNLPKRALLSGVQDTLRCIKECCATLQPPSPEHVF